MPTHAPKHLVTHFESVSTFLSYLAPGCSGRDPPHESYLSQGRLWGGRGTSRVRLLYTGAITMALKPPFSSLYYHPIHSRRLTLYPLYLTLQTLELSSSFSHSSQPTCVLSSCTLPSYTLSSLTEGCSSLRSPRSTLAFLAVLILLKNVVSRCFLQGPSQRLVPLGFE